jgi:drug/metabolite transporter (DMT)-like permease
MLAAGILYERYGDVEIVRRILSGIAPAAAGLLIATVAKMAKPMFRSFGPAPVILLATAFAIGLMRWPLLLVLIVLAPLSIALAWWTQRPRAHVWRAMVGLSTMVTAFSALAYLPLAESTTIGFAAPLFAVLLSALVLKETVGPHRWSAVALGLVGVLLVMRPEGRDLPAVGLALATLSAFGVGLVTITIRQIGRTEHPQTTVLWFSLLSMLTLSAFLPFYAQLHDMRTWGILLALGGFGGFGQIFLTTSLRYAPVSVVVPFDYTQLLWSVWLGVLIFGDAPPSTTWAGAAVIVASGLYTLYREHRLGREKVRAVAPL